MYKPEIFSSYITKEIFKYFFFIYFTLLILFFSIDLLDIIDSVKGIKNGFSIAVKISLFRAPSFLESLLHFILLLSSLFVFYKLSNNSEMVIMQTNGRSLLQIIKFPMIIAFIFGIIIVTIYNPISSSLNSRSERLKLIYIYNEREDFTFPRNGIWFKQVIDDEEVIIRINSLYKNILLFKNVIFFYTKNGVFVRQINMDSLLLGEDGNWIGTNNYIIDDKGEMSFEKKKTFSLNLSNEFIEQVINKSYDSINNISFWKIKNSIKFLESSGFDSLRFKVRYYYYLTLPFIYSIFVIISAYFGIVNFRDNKKIISVIKGIISGFLIFIIHNLIIEFANVRKITILDGSVIIIFIYMAIAILLLIKKDIINNYNINLDISNILALIIIFFVKIYQKCISPFCHSKCNFRPTCSQYMIDVIKEYGVFTGVKMGICRIFKCTPNREITFDPVLKREDKKE